MKHRGFALVEIVVMSAVIIIAAVVLHPVVTKSFRAKECCDTRPACQSNLKQIGLAFRQYTQDAGEKFPPTAISDVVSANSFYGWGDAIQPYLKSTQIYQCMDEPDVPAQPAAPTQYGYTDYWYNQNLAGCEEKEVASVSQTILAGDGNDSSDDSTARYSISKLSDAWRADKKSPIYRHLEGSNYAFADGHVKWYKPEDISDTVSKGKPWFAIK